MVQAAALKGVDYGAADVRGRWWWLKLRWMLNQLENANIIGVLRLQHAQHSAVLDYKLEQSAFDLHWKGANDLSLSIHKMLFPWLSTDGKTQRSAEIDKMMSDWRQRYGDPKDPNVKAHFKKIADALRRKGEKALKEGNFADQKRLRENMEKLRQSRRKGKK